MQYFTRKCTTPCLFVLNMQLVHSEHQYFISTEMIIHWIQLTSGTEEKKIETSQNTDTLIQGTILTSTHLWPRPTKAVGQFCRVDPLGVQQQEPGKQTLQLKGNDPDLKQPMSKCIIILSHAMIKCCVFLAIYKRLSTFNMLHP